jgi:hypothetical protein
MKHIIRNLERQYILASYPSEQAQKTTLKVILRKNANNTQKPFIRHTHKKNIFMLESHG